MIRPSEPAERRALAAGEAGAAWLAGFDGLLRRLLAGWRLSFEAPLTGGTEAFVAAVTTARGRPAVLKMALPSPAFATEVGTLLAAAGRGYAEVFAHDLSCGAVLMERLGAQLAAHDLPVEAQIERICATLADAWMKPPADLAVPHGAEKANGLAALISTTWHEMERPCSARTVETALRFAAIRAACFDPTTAVLAHGDAHAWNTLAIPGGRHFKLVDPDGVFVEPAYDLAIPMREWSAELLTGDPVRLARRRCHLLAALSGLDPEAIWQWGFIERVSTGLLCAQLALPEARDMLAVADILADAME